MAQRSLSVAAMSNENPTRQRRYADSVNIPAPKGGRNRAVEIEAVFIAGAFGTYLDVQSGIDIGMFPRLEKNALFRWVMRPDGGQVGTVVDRKTKTGCVRCPPGDLT